jgi:hypothetical protein
VIKDVAETANGTEMAGTTTCSAMKNAGLAISCRDWNKMPADPVSHGTQWGKQHPAKI